MSSNAITGNWQVTSNAAAAGHLPSLSGVLTGSASSITGIFHSNSSTDCVSPTTKITLSGDLLENSVVSLTGPLAGGTLSVTGALASDGKSLSGATYSVTGGTCAFSAPAVATAQSFSSVTGNYAGSLSDASGPVLTITGSLTQTPDADTSGNFQLSGTGTFPDQSCFASPASISNSQVTGGSFSFTYADPTSGNSVAVSGTFSPDANTLTITNWTLTGGSCPSDNGTGLFTRVQ